MEKVIAFSALVYSTRRRKGTTSVVPFGRGPQGFKPLRGAFFSAWLKPCPYEITALYSNPENGLGTWDRGRRLRWRQRDDDFAGTRQAEPLPREFLDGARIAPQVLDRLVELLVFVLDFLDVCAQRLNLPALRAPLQVAVLSRNSEQHQRQNHRRAAREYRNAPELFLRSCFPDRPDQPNKNRRAAAASSSNPFSVRASQ